MQTDLLRAEQLSERDLAARAGEPNPFFEADFALAAHRYLRPEGSALLVAASEREWLACVPSRRRRASSSPLPYLSSCRHSYCFLGTPLVDRSRAEEALGGLIDRARGEGGGLFALECLGMDGPVSAALETVLDAREVRPILHTSFERATLSREQARTLGDMRPRRPGERPLVDRVKATTMHSYRRLRG